MQLPRTITDNLKFLVVEVNSQLKHLQTCFSYESASVAQRIINRSGYTYNLAIQIKNGCGLQLSRSSQKENLTARAVAAIASDLERISELCRDCIQQMGYLRDDHHLDLSVYIPLLRMVSQSIMLVETALINSDTRLALKLGRTEHKLDKAYVKLLGKYTTKLKNKKNTEDLVTGLFVAKCIEQMGDALLDISESILTSSVGQPMDVKRFHSLRDTVESWLDEDTLSNLEVKAVAETRSGSGISSVHYVDENDEQQLAIFKDGEKRKLKEEFKGVESWHEIYPGVAPQILTYRKSGNTAALLIEHLHGITFEQILLQPSPEVMRCSMQALKNTLHSIWQETRKDKATSASFISQTRKRLPDVYAIHPYFRQGDVRVCGKSVDSFEELLDKAEQFEKKIPATFSVFIHGDFNVDNIIFDQEQDKVNFIDLHRSCYMDYVQDVSVFMVSNYRLQVFETPVRQRILKQVLSFYEVVHSFALRQSDKTFKARLALGLARSFATSTRFILDKSMARRMFLRAVFLLEQVIRSDLKNPESLHLPLKEIFSD